MRLSAPERRRGERPVRKGRRAGIVQARRPEVRGCAEPHPFNSPYWPRDAEAAATWRVAGLELCRVGALARVRGPATATHDGPYLSRRGERSQTDRAGASGSE